MYFVISADCFVITISCLKKGLKVTGKNSSIQYRHGVVNGSTPLKGQSNKRSYKAVLALTYLAIVVLPEVKSESYAK